MAKEPRIATDDDGFPIASDAGDLAEQHEINEDDDDFDLLGDDSDDDLDDSDDGDVEAADEADADLDDDDDGDDEDRSELTSVPRVPRKGKEKPKTKAQERIEELAAKRREAEAAAFKAEMEAIEERKRREELEARIAALESGRPTAAAPRKPDPKDFEYGEVDTKYIDAMVEYKLDMERKKFLDQRENETQEQENARLAQHYKDRLAKIQADGKKRFQDFDNIVNRVDFPGQVARDVLDSEYGVDIAYYLGKNIDKLREISLMTDSQRARAMGRLEERFSARASAGKKRSQAPETPGRKAQKGKPAHDAKYGPDDQDEFDKALFGR